MRTFPSLLGVARPALLAASLLGFGLSPAHGDGAGDGAAMDRAADSLTQALGQGWDDCALPEREPQAAAGHWKGFYRVSYDLVSARATVHNKMEGKLEFDLARHEEPEQPKTTPPSDPLRTPLGSKPASSPGPKGTSVSAEDLAKAWDRLNGTLPADTEVNAEADALAKAIMAEYQGNYQGLYVGPGQPGKIQGDADYSLTASLDLHIPGLKFAEPMGTKEPLPLEVRGEEDLESNQFKDIWLWGDPAQAKFGATFDIATQNSSATGQVDLQSGTLDYHAVATDADGHRTTTSGNRSGDIPGGKRGLIRLKVLAQDCWRLSGTVDTSEIAKAMASGGFRLVVTDTEWIATLEERDVDFEKQVQALVSEPIPSPLTWDYVERFNQRWQALRKSGKLTDYRLCVLKDADRKGVEITVAGLRELLRDFPKVRDMNACAAMTVVTAALQRILPLIRRLQLEGVDCPLADSLNQVASNELQKLAKNVLGRKHTLDELTCLAGFAPFRYGVMDYGDQSDAVRDAWMGQVQSLLTAARKN